MYYVQKCTQPIWSFSISLQHQFTQASKLSVSLEVRKNREVMGRYRNVLFIRSVNTSKSSNIFLEFRRNNLYSFVCDKLNRSLAMMAHVLFPANYTLEPAYFKSCAHSFWQIMRPARFCSLQSSPTIKSWTNSLAATRWLSNRQQWKLKHQGDGFSFLMWCISWWNLQRNIRKLQERRASSSS